MKRLFVLVAAVLVMSMLMTSCGSGNQSNGGEEPAEPAGEKVLRIGGMGPLTGDYANYGLSVRNGAQVAVDEINANGGINGMTVVLDMQDSQADVDTAVAAYGKLMDNGMNVSIGTTLSGCMASVSLAAVDDDILLLSPSASNDSCISTNDKAFRICFTDSSQGKFSADYIVEHKLADTVAVLYQSDLDYSVGLYESFEAQAKVLGLNIAEVQTFDNNTNTDFSTQVNAINSSGAKLVFIPIYAAEASTFLSQAKGKLSDDTLYFGCDGLDGILTKVENDVSIADNVLELTPFSADDPDPKVQNFVEKYKADYKAAPDQFAADAYDAIYVIKAVIEKANITDPSECSGELLASYMTEITVSGVTGTMTWEKNGDTDKDAKAMIIKDGVASLYQG
ncbi:MAG: ABC transporter substrate-binding protein [Oscillospiraceae bacterium]|nr:ABC transporter substrate-binding protein [Oscillospiraceae bacterium]